MTHQFFDLTAIPTGTVSRSINVAVAEKGLRKTVSVTFDERTANGLPDVDFVDMPTFLDDLIASGQIPAQKVVTKTVSLDNAVSDGFDALLDPAGTQLKILIDLKQ